MTDIRKLNFTLPSGATFNAEGTEEYVSKALSDFKALLEMAPNPQPPKALKNDESKGVPPLDGSGLPLDRLFSQDDYYGVALLAKPKTDDPDADGVLGILYGFAVLKKETTVTAIKLQRAAEKSGLNTPRLNRTVAKHAAFITETGKAKGKKYGLNNPGMAQALEILKGILG
jgi:hypothetical protein